MKKRILSSLLTASAYALALALTLAACGPQSGPASSASGSAPISAPLTNAGASEPSPAAPQDLGADAAKAYRRALEGIYNDHCYPNGDPVDVPDGAQMENNSFAFFDVDGDGETELIYQNDDSTTAGMMTSIFSFDPYTKDLYLELAGFAAMTFYDNGIIRVEAAHNHGLSGRDDFWPFTLYQYDSGGDGYLMIGSVDAWDKSLFPEDFQGVPFPDDADQDGDGVVYLITYSGQEVTTTPLDGPDYEKWLNTYIEGAAELELPWQAMTLENIQAVTP